MALTANGGRSWQISRAPWVVSRPQFDAAGNGWAQGVSNQRVARFYVTHDWGRTWTTAPSASPSPGLGPVSIAGGEVWSMGEACQPTCNVTIVHGAASGNRMTAAAAQPITGDALNLEVVAASTGVAYVSNPQKPLQSFVTHDDGRSWRRFSAPCPRLQESTGLAAGGPESLWDSCRHGGGSVLRRSADGGRHWTTYPIAFGTMNMLQPVSAEVAWAQTINGHIVRTTNGGRSWSTVWKVSGSQPPTLAGHSPMLTAQDTSTAPRPEPPCDSYRPLVRIRPVPLGPGLLASGLLGTIIRDLQPSLADPDHALPPRPQADEEDGKKEEQRIEVHTTERLA